jgi:hypothetical protein
LGGVISDNEGVYIDASDNTGLIFYTGSQPGSQPKMIMDTSGNINLLGDISANDASFNDLSLTNLYVHQDISANNINLRGKLDVNGDALIHGLTVGRGGDNHWSNTVLGSSALYRNTDGSNNVANGYQALTNNTIGYNNVANGYKALHQNTTGYGNTANGYQALSQNTIGYNNVANGYKALHQNTTGFSNTANGFEALYNNSGGANNVTNGYQALKNNISGNGNTATGFQALLSNTGYNNTANGYQALSSNTSGTKNTAIGFEAGKTINGLNNTICIGNGAQVTGSDMCRIGNDLMKVGIGTDSPNAKLQVNGDFHIKGTNDAWGAVGKGLYFIFDNAFASGYVQCGDFSGPTGPQYYGLKFEALDYNFSSRDGIELVYMHQNGNVGFGTSDPKTRLDFGFAVGGSIRLGRENGYNWDITKNNSIGRGISGEDMTDMLSWYAGIHFINENSIDDAIAFTTYQSTTGIGERLRISGNGNVGIGLQDPQDKIHTTGNIRIGGEGVIRAARNAYNHSGSLTLQAGGSGSSESEVHSFRQQDGVELKLSTISGKTLQYKQGNNTVLYVDNNNRVGIGTTSPTHLLTVGESYYSAATKTTSMSILAPGETSNAILYFGANHSMDRPPKIAVISEGRTEWGKANLHFCLDNTDDNTTAASLTNSRMTILPDGNVGIDTTSPRQKLSVNGNVCIFHKNQESVSGALIFRHELYERAFYMAAESWGGSAGTTDNAKLCMGYHAAAGGVVSDNPITEADFTTGTIMTLQGNGNVGIGATSPAEKLEVNGNIMVRGGISIYNNTNSYTDTPENQISLDCNGNSGKSGIVWKPEYSDSTTTYTKTAAGIYFVPGLGHFRGGLSFFTNNTESRSTNALERMRIDHDGNVGIGITSPDYKLDIRGSGDQVINVYSDGTGSAYARFSTNNNTTSGSLMYIGAQENSATGDECFINSRYNYPIRFYQNNTHAMTIANGGNVGIGTTSPKSKLDVEGDTLIQGDIHIGTVPAGDTSQAARWLYFDNIDDNGYYGNGPTTIGGIIFRGNENSDYIVGTLPNFENYCKIDVDAATAGGGTLRGDIKFWTRSAGGGAGDGSGMFERMRIRYDGNVGIGTPSPAQKLHVAGNAVVTGDITAYYSDERLKTFKGKIKEPLAKIKQLNGYYFVENELAKSLGYDNDKLQVGVSAQEVEKVLPEIVTKAPIDNKYKTVWYQKLTPLLIEGMKEQQAQIETQQTQIETQQTQIESLQKQMDELKALINK